MTFVAANERAVSWCHCVPFPSRCIQLLPYRKETPHSTVPPYALLAEPTAGKRRSHMYPQRPIIHMHECQIICSFDLSLFQDSLRRYGHFPSERHTRFQGLRLTS